MSYENPVNYPHPGNALGCDVAISTAEREKYERQQRVVDAVYVLSRARDIRADAQLMVEIRSYIRAERDRIGVLLDEL